MGNDQSNDSKKAPSADRSGAGDFPNGTRRPGDMDRQGGNVPPNVQDPKGGSQRGRPDVTPANPQAGESGRTGGDRSREGSSR